MRVYSVQLEADDHENKNPKIAKRKHLGLLKMVTGTWLDWSKGARLLKKATRQRQVGNVVARILTRSRTC